MRMPYNPWACVIHTMSGYLCLTEFHRAPWTLAFCFIGNVWFLLMAIFGHGELSWNFKGDVVATIDEWVVRRGGPC